MWGHARLMFGLVLLHPVVPNGRFGIVCVGVCAHVGFVQMERVLWMGGGARVAVDHCWCSRADLQKVCI